MNDINAGLDALQDSIEKRISHDVQTLEDSHRIFSLIDYLESTGVWEDRFPTDKELKEWANTLRRIAIPRPVGERE